MARKYKKRRSTHREDTMKHRTRRKGHRGHRRGKALSAAHKKAISEGLKRHHRGGGHKKRRKGKGHRKHGKRRMRRMKRA